MFNCASLSLPLSGAVYHVLSLLHAHFVAGPLRLEPDPGVGGGGPGDTVRGGAGGHAAVCMRREGLLFQ